MELSVFSCNATLQIIRFQKRILFQRVICFLKTDDGNLTDCGFDSFFSQQMGWKYVVFQKKKRKTGSVKEDESFPIQNKGRRLILLLLQIKIIKLMTLRGMLRVGSAHASQKLTIPVKQIRPINLCLSRRIKLTRSRLRIDHHS